VRQHIFNAVRRGSELFTPYRLTVAIIVVLIVTSGIVHGHFSGRWDSREDHRLREKKLEEFPSDFGSWQCRETLALPAAAQSMLECQSYLYRHYVHRDSGKSVTVAVLVGPTGPMSVHTPEICYSSRDYRLQENRQQVATRLRETQAQLWKTTFYPAGADSRLLRVYYGWNDGRGWKAPSEPRFSFIGTRRLYKIQLATLLTSAVEAGDDPCSQFLEQFLPVLEQYLARSAGQP
jgi:hypothetical protein